MLLSTIFFCIVSLFVPTSAVLQQQCTSCDVPNPVVCPNVCAGQLSFHERCRDMLPVNATDPKTTIRIIKDAKSYDQANADCINQGGRLLIVHGHSIEKTAFMLNWIWNTGQLTISETAYLALRQFPVLPADEPGNKWNWVDSNGQKMPIIPANVNWKQPSEPADNGAVITTDGTLAGTTIMVVQCNSTHNYLCELCQWTGGAVAPPATVSPAPPTALASPAATTTAKTPAETTIAPAETTTITASATTPVPACSGMVCDLVVATAAGGNKCLAHHPGAALNGDGAASYCAAIGQHLVTIKAPSEKPGLQTYAHAMGFDHIWLGLTDKVVENTFVWADGTPANYTDWGGVEPNNGPPNDDCVAADCGATYFDNNCLWFDIPCDSSFTSEIICETACI